MTAMAAEFVRRSNPDLAVAVRTLFMLGLRPSELLAL
jgi:hypothetical protein